MGPAGRRRRLAAPGPGLPATDRTLARTTAALHRQDAGKLAACGRAARDAARRHGDRNAPRPARNRVVVLQATLLPAAAFFVRLRPHRRLHGRLRARDGRSEEHTSELQSLMRISYAVFCLKKKKNHRTTHTNHNMITTYNLTNTV